MPDDEPTPEKPESPESYVTPNNWIRPPAFQQPGNRTSNELHPKVAFFIQNLAYHAVFFIPVLLVTVVLYPLTQPYIEPIVALVFPIAESSLLKSVAVVSAFYWGTVIIKLAILSSPKRSS